MVRRLQPARAPRSSSGTPPVPSGRSGRGAAAPCRGPTGARPDPTGPPHRPDRTHRAPAPGSTSTTERPERGRPPIPMPRRRGALRYVMAETPAPRQPSMPRSTARSAVLDSAHVGDIHGRLRDDPRARPRLAPVVDGAPAHPARHHGPRPHRHGGGQRRRRGGHLQPGRAELRALAAVGPAPAHPGAGRQPGDGGAPRGGHRRRARPPHQRALRQVLGRLLGGRPVHPQLPHHRHRVHRGQPGPRLLRGLQVLVGAAGRRRPGGR